jgi:hypothetical protein
VAATFDTKAPSAAIERRRLLMLRLWRLSERRVVFIEVEAVGKMRSDSRSGADIVSVGVLIGHGTEVERVKFCLV